MIQRILPYFLSFRSCPVEDNKDRKEKDVKDVKDHLRSPLESYLSCKDRNSSTK